MTVRDKGDDPILARHWQGPLLRRGEEGEAGSEWVGRRTKESVTKDGERKNANEGDGTSQSGRKDSGDDKREARRTADWTMRWPEAAVR